MTNNENFTFTIGSEICKSQVYCNGPLKSGTKYALTLRAFSGTDFVDSEPIELETRQDFQLLLILIFIGLIAMIAATLAIFFCHQKLSKTRGQMLPCDYPESIAIAESSF
jgi:hypothetical protein